MATIQMPQVNTATASAVSLVRSVPELADGRAASQTLSHQRISHTRVGSFRSHPNPHNAWPDYPPTGQLDTSQPAVSVYFRTGSIGTQYQPETSIQHATHAVRRSKHKRNETRRKNLHKFLPPLPKRKKKAAKTGKKATTHFLTDMIVHEQGRHEIFNASSTRNRGTTTAARICVVCSFERMGGSSEAVLCCAVDLI
ncbi:uncharacterized protein BKA78DRAFT_157265 [Phyllosticta capitalensis]|uniref:uncharacterized protein n=1 Tax=Phyllosticta capitalensis TaxID=121624 RepID=UPI00312E3341